MPSLVFANVYHFSARIIVPSVSSGNPIRALLYSILNIAIFLVSAFVVLPGITTQLLVGHVEFAQYSYGRGVSLVAWIYLILFGALALRYDKGSEINTLLAGS